MRIVLVASEFNAPLPDRMLAAAERKAKALRVDYEVVRVPGCWEIPLAVRTALLRRDVEAAVAIGAIVRGETKHDELIAEAVADALMHLQVTTGKPVGLGITGPAMTWEQAEARVESAARAVDAAVRAASARRPRSHPRPHRP